MSQKKSLPKHSVSIQIRFNDIDGLGHVNNSVYAQYFDMGRQGYFETLNGGSLNWKKAGLIIASTHTEFLMPIFLSDRIEVRTSIHKVGNKSLQMTQGIYDSTSKEIKATCQSVMVGFNPANGESEMISDIWREKIAQFEA